MVDGTERAVAQPVGPGDILALIRGGSVTRAQLQETTGLSRVTVAQRVDALLEAGYIREFGVGRSTGGRRPAELQFDHTHACLVVAVIDTTHTKVAAVDLLGAVLAETEIDASIHAGPETVLELIEGAVAKVLADAGLGADRLAGIGVSVPAPVDPHTGRPSEPPLMHGWDGYPIAEHMQASFPVTVVVENDANVMALGEHALEHPAARALCLVKVSTGIGAGVVINGSIYTGSDGGAGDIGHVRAVGHEDAVCTCGSHGCLAAVASGGAVARQLTEVGIPASSGRDVKELLAAGNSTALRLTRQAGRRIGEVMAAVVSLLNPTVLVISGDLASNTLLSGIRETLYPLSLPRATRNLDVRLGAHRSTASYVGLARIIVESVFGARAVNAALQG